MTATANSIRASNVPVQVRLLRRLSFTLRSRNSGFNVVNFGQSNDIVVPGDYDGDGNTDLAVVREGSSPTDNLTWIIRYSTTGEIKTKNWGVTGTDLTAQNDYDGDGKTDMAVWRNSNGQFYVLRSSTRRY